jgi:hypothetical protein
VGDGLSSHLESGSARLACVREWVMGFRATSKAAQPDWPASARTLSGRAFSISA